MKCGRCGQILTVNGPNATCVCCGAVYGPEQEPLPTEPAKVESEPTDTELLDWLEMNGDKFDIQCNLAFSTPFLLVKPQGKVGEVFHYGQTLRAAIKQAMWKRK